MENTQLPEFLTSYFVFEGNPCKMTAVPEMLPSKTGLDFTGNYIGILIVNDHGTIVFERDQHPDKVWVCDKKPLGNAPSNFPFNFTFKTLENRGDQYKVVLTHELGSWGEDFGLDPTGSFEGILIGEKTGTLAFTLLPNEKDGWVCEYQSSEKIIEDWLADMLGEIADKIRANAFA